MAKKNKFKGMTRQNVRDLSHLKSTSTGRVLSEPPGMGANCEHPDASCHRHADTGITHCSSCGSLWDEEGIPV